MEVNKDKLVIFNTHLGLRSFSYETVSNLVMSEFNSVKSLYSSRINTLKDYFKELNNFTTLPKPETSWESDINSSILFQKTIFVYTFLRSLFLSNFNSKYASITSTQFPEVASIITKLFNLIVENKNLLEAIDKALFYGIVSGKFVVKVEPGYEVDVFGDLDRAVIIDAIHPLNTHLNDNGTIIIDTFLDIEKAYKLSYLWDFFDVSYLKPYDKNQDNTSQIPQLHKPFVKISEAYVRLIVQDIVLPLTKFTILNDTHLVHIEEVKSLDNTSPLIVSSFYNDDLGVSYVDLIWHYYKEDTRFLRKIIDRAILSTAFGYEVNVESVVENDFEVRPFSVIRKRGSEEAVRPIQWASFDPNILPIRQLIVNEAQNISGITEFLMGMPTSKGRPTASEVISKTQQSQKLISTLVERFENSFVSKVILKVLVTYIQLYNKELIEFLPLTDSERLELDKLFGKDISQSKPLGYNLVKVLYKHSMIKLNGMVSAINSELEVSSLMQLLQVASQLGLTPFLDVPNIFTSIFQRLGISLDYVRIPTQEEYLSILSATLQNAGMKDGKEKQ